ncbi:MAG: adenylate/guanylate cyclase domain-containing protein, partial [Candidatus Rifleibacteriota bacterium]
MKIKIRHSVFMLLFILPLLAFNAGYFQISEIYVRWQKSEQERFARQKLGEIAANTNFTAHLCDAGNRLTEKLSSALEELEDSKFRKLDWDKITRKVLAHPFPDTEVFLLKKPKDSDRSEIFHHHTDRSFNRRSIEMMFSFLVQTNQEKKIGPDEKRRNEKILKKVFGSGSDSDLIGKKHRAVATPVIYNKVPAWLLWDFSTSSTGENTGFFMLVRRDQDLNSASLKLTALETGLGEKIPGGFIKLFESGSDDQYYPGRISTYRPFMDWREKIGLCDEKTLLDWQYKGFPWQKELGSYNLYTWILIHDKHLLFILLPAIPKNLLPDFFFLMNLFSLALVSLMLLRGWILNVWPGNAIRTRFLMFFSLAVALPMTLFIVSSTAFIFDRLKEDENMLEETLSASLLDFDAGKEQIENDYCNTFSICMQDGEILRKLASSGLQDKEEILSQAVSIFSQASEKLPLAGIAFFDLNGNIIKKGSDVIPIQDFEPIANFYGYNIATNLRRQVSILEPDFPIPEMKVEEKNLGAFQAYGKGTNSMEHELERFRGRIFRTKFGRGKIVSLHDFILVGGKPRFAMLICWLDSQVDSAVLSRSANLLALKNPQIRVLAYRSSPEGNKLVFPPDRSFNFSTMATFRKFADSALNMREGFMRGAEGNLSLVGYCSLHFNDTILIAGMDKSDNIFNHWIRVSIFLGIGVIGLTIMILSGFISYLRIVKPLEEIKQTLDEVQSGKLEFSGDTSRKDEIGLLYREFEKMISGLQERQRLASILSDHAVDAVSSGEGHLKGQQFQAVVLISDIRNFTVLGETYPPAILTEMLNRHFSEMAKIITENGGQIYKFIGDAIEAFFVNDAKFPVSPAIRAVESSIKMLGRLETINSERKKNGSFVYRIGIGLATGEIIAGETGSVETRLEYAMIGQVFKRAEKFEAFTKKITGLPLVFDAEIAKALDEKSHKLQKHLLEEEQVFSILELTSEFNSLQVAEVIEKKAAEPIIEDRPESFNQQGIMRKIKGGRQIVFITGLVCLLFLSIAWYLTNTFKHEKLVKHRRDEIRENIEFSLMKGGFGDEKVILEEFLQFESDQIATRLKWSDSGVSSESFRNSVDNSLEILKSAGIMPLQFAALHKPGGKEIDRITDDWKIVRFLGKPELKNDCETLLQRLMLIVASRHYERFKEFQDKIPSLIGLRIEVDYLFNDLHARVQNIKRMGREEYIYWQPVFLQNPEFKVDLKQVNLAHFLRQKPGPEAILGVGVVIFNFDINQVKSAFFKMLGKVFENDGTEYAIIFEKGNSLVSKGFPVATELLDYQNSFTGPNDWMFSQRYSQFETKKFKIVLAQQLNLPEKGRFDWLPIAFFLLISWMWYKTVFHEQIIARAFALQLWLGLLAAAVIPIASVYLVNELNAIDQEKITLNQERLRLINLFEKLEQRQLLQEIRAWEVIQKKDRDPALSRLLDQLDNEQTPELFKKIEKRVRTIAENVRYNEMIIFSNRGWNISVYPQDLTREVGEFKRFIQTFAADYFHDFGNAIQQPEEQKLGDAVKGEMTREAGLEIFRSLFGSDAYFGLVHGLNLPVRIFANTGLAVMQLIASPSIKKPDRIFFWLFLDDLNNTMRRIFRNTETDFAIFTDSKAMYGTLKQPYETGFANDSVSACRWADATKAPISITRQILGKKFRVEARIGRINEVMLLVGLIPEELLLENVE